MSRTVTTDNVDAAACERALAYIKMMRRGYDLSHIVFVSPFVRYTVGEGAGDTWKDPSAIIAGAIGKYSNIRGTGDDRAYSINLNGVVEVEFAVKHNYMKLFREVRCLTIHKRRGKYICKIPGYIGNGLRDDTFAIVPVPPFHRNEHMVMRLVLKMQSVAAKLSARKRTDVAAIPF